MKNTEHIGTISESFTEDEFCAECSCGWIGKFCDTRRMAEFDLDKHYVEAKFHAD